MSDDHVEAYKKAGVNPEQAGRLIEGFLSRLPQGGPLPSDFFCQILPLPFQKGLYLTLSTDGVGTKILLGLETGIIKGLGQDLVAMVYNDLICCGTQPLAFLDYYATSKMESSAYSTILSSIEEACKKCQMPLLGGETAEMPGLYQMGHFDLAGFGVGMVREEKLLCPSKVHPGQILCAFPSSGFHSNGYSLLRKILKDKNIHLKEIQSLDGEKKSLAEFLLEPTRLYIDLQQAHEKGEICLSALAHITGGSYEENLPRIYPENCQAVVEKKNFPGAHKELFDWFRHTASLSWEDMLAIFNCGYGMVAIAEEKDIGELFQKFPEAQKIGWIEKKSDRGSALRWA